MTKQKKVKTDKTIPTIIISWIVIIGMVVIGIVTYWATCSRAINASLDAYTKTKELVKENTKSEYSQRITDYFEKVYHTSNRTYIDIGSLKTQSVLEVLSVTLEDFSVYEEKNDQYWAKAAGTCVFTVDLKAGEYIIDNSHANVIVRLPKPVLFKCSLDDQSIVDLFSNVSDKKGNAQKGVSIADYQMKEIYNKIQCAISSDPSYYEEAEESAQEIITKLIKAMNPNIPDLTVEVEFIA